MTTNTDKTVESLFLKQVIRNKDGYREMLHLRRECQGRIHSFIKFVKGEYKTWTFEFDGAYFLIFMAKE